MAILGFSHVTCEVINLDEIVKHWQSCGFRKVFELTMAVPPCKFPVLNGDPTQVRLVYLIFKEDEACNIELISHNGKPTNQMQNDNLIPIFMSKKIQKKEYFRDQEGNQIVLIPFTEGLPSKHYVLPSSSPGETSRFYQQYFSLKIIETPVELALPRETVSLSLERCLHPHWQGMIHIVGSKNESHVKFLNSKGFQSFCFLINDSKNDIYQKFNKNKVFGPIEELKIVKGNPVPFEVGFFYDPSGFPVEYLQITF